MWWVCAKRSVGLFKSQPPFCATPASERSMVRAAENWAFSLPFSTSCQWPRTSHGPATDGGSRRSVGGCGCRCVVVEDPTQFPQLIMVRRLGQSEGAYAQCQDSKDGSCPQRTFAFHGITPDWKI